MTTQTSSRKLDHLRLCAEQDVVFGDAGFGDVRLVHNALPECSLDEIDTRVNFLGHRLASPLFIAAITGGHPGTTEINRTLAAAAESRGLAIGVGSQRAALEDASLEDSFRVVRDTAPHAFVAGNLGAAQLVSYGVEGAERAVEMIDADALCIHLNFLQEAIQPEGDRSAAGVLAAIRETAHELSVPVIVKETGSGISRETAASLFAAGCAALDVGGFGGTSWARIEGLRAGDKTAQTLGRTFLEWGIPTAVSVFEVAQVKSGPVICTGGLHTGLDIAKAAALGADMGGMALALLTPALAGTDALCAKIDAVIRELRTAMFLTGAQNMEALAHVRYYLTGNVWEMTENKNSRKMI
ncbi:MAG: type 2 isopentenyl-diphosphate Delta-isomerase [Methanocorpusculum sp.]|nr:type 2 isopentenyl-diphosphate Delta-isomerase [Methanocorpusculum sp.]